MTSVIIEVLLLFSSAISGQGESSIKAFGSLRMAAAE